jgi:hypothetical protein
MPKASYIPFRSHLDTLLFVASESLNKLRIQLECNAGNLSFDQRAKFEGCLGNLSNIVDMVSEIAVCHEGVLHDVVRTLHELADAGRIDSNSVNDVLEEYSDSMGEIAADQLIAAAIRK